MIGTTITTPDSVYGIAKSTNSVLFALIVASPTTASKFYQVGHPKNRISTKHINKLHLLNLSVSKTKKTRNIYQVLT